MEPPPLETQELFAALQYNQEQTNRFFGTFAGTVPMHEFYSPENIQERLALRNYLDELRGTGERTGGPAALDNTDRKRFADQLDRFLARQPKG